MAQQMKLSVLIDANASGAKAGGAEAVAAIDKVSVAGERAAVSLVGVADAGGRAGAGFERSGAGANASATAIARIGQSANQSTASVRGLIEAQTGLSRAPVDLDKRAGQIAAYGAELDALRAKYNPMYAAIARYKSEVMGIRQAHSVGAISTDEMAAAMSRERRSALASIDAIKGRTSALRTMQTVQVAAANNNAQAFQTANIAAQFQDIGVTAAMGMSPLQIALQQGTQLSMVMASMQNPIRGLGAAFMSVVSPVSLLTIGLVATTAAAIQYFTTAEDGAGKTSRVFEEQNDVIRRAAQLWGDVVPAFKAYVDELDRADKITSGRDASEILAGRELDGLAEKIVGLQQQYQSAVRVMRQLQADPAFIRDFSTAFGDLREKLDNGTASTADLGRVQTALASAIEDYGKPEVMSFKDAFDKVTASINNSIAAAQKARQEWIKTVAGGATVQDIVDNNSARIGDRTLPAGSLIPRNPAVPTSRPLRELEGDGTEAKQAEKTESAYQQLLRTADQRLAQARNEIAIAGEAAGVQARLRAEYDAEAQYRERIAQIKGATVDDREIAILRQKAALLAEINSQLAGQKLLEGQRDQIEQLRLESQLIGATASERARATAALQAEQQLRQQGVDLMSREAEAYRANAVTIAETRLQLERQQGAYQAAQQAGGTMIDQLTVGTGSLKDRLKSVADTLLTTFQQLAIANPLKNMLLGQNNPTISDLFTGKGTSTSPVSSTASMTVTAGTVMINGVPVGSPAGLLNAANTNVPAAANVNGVRPSLTPSGIVNSPVGAAATVSGTDVQSQVWNYWAAKGLPPHQIAGIMGNVGAESSFNPAAVGDNGAALGLAQWNDRGPAMTAAVPDWRTNVQGQLDFMNREFQTTENASWQRLTSATDVRSATAAMAGYERPLGYSATNPEGAHNFSGRLQGADQAMQKFGQTTKTAADQVDTFGTGALDATKALNTGSQSITGSVNTLATQTAQVPAQSQGLFSTLFSSLGQGVQGIGSGIGGIFSSLFGGLFADGAAFSGGAVTAFASGGVVDRPTTFAMSGGRTGLMGEAGPEAIVPLKRGSDGKLGVTMALPRQARQGGDMRLNLSSNHTLVVQGSGDKALMENMYAGMNELVDIRDRNLRSSIPDLIKAYSQNPWARES